jgi:hypothetical protein
MAQPIRSLELAARRKDAEDAKLYLELIYAVGKIYPNETRHQTALRYIQEAESCKYEVAQCQERLTFKGRMD